MKGSVSKPRNLAGTWNYRLDPGLDDRGRRKQREISGVGTKKNAQAALDDAQRGTCVPSSRTTVRDFLDTWHEGTKAELAITVWMNYGRVVRIHIDPHLGSKRLSELSPLDIKKRHGVLLDSGCEDGGPLAIRTVRLSHRVLHRAVEDAVRWNLIVVNPVSQVRVPKGESAELTVWTVDEARSSPRVEASFGSSSESQTTCHLTLCKVTCEAWMHR
jgi:hypothetical protein